MEKRDAGSIIKIIMPDKARLFKVSGSSSNIKEYKNTVVIITARCVEGDIPAKKPYITAIITVKKAETFLTVPFSVKL